MERQEHAVAASLKQTAQPWAAPEISRGERLPGEAPRRARGARREDPWAQDIRSTCNSLLHTSTFGPFSAVSMPFFASKNSSFSIFRDLQDVHSLALLQSPQPSKFSPKLMKIFSINFTKSWDFSCYMIKFAGSRTDFVEISSELILKVSNKISRNFGSSCTF